MLAKSLAPPPVPATTEMRVAREGAGRQNWHWSLWRDERLVARSPNGFAGAEEAYQAGRVALLQPRPAPVSPAVARRR